MTLYYVYEVSLNSENIQTFDSENSKSFEAFYF